jgi:hypothetical protein
MTEDSKIFFDDTNAMPRPNLSTPLAGRSYALPLTVTGFADWGAGPKFIAVYEAACYPNYQHFTGSVPANKIFTFPVTERPLGENYIHIRYAYVDSNYYPPRGGQSVWYDTGKFYVMANSFINTSDDGEIVITEDLSVSGEAHIGASLTVMCDGVAVSRTIQVPETGRWTVTLDQKLPGGSGSIYVEQQVAGYSAVASEPVAFTSLKR